MKPDHPDILEKLPNPLFLLSNERHVLYANTAAANLFDTISLNADLSLTIRHPEVLDAVERTLEQDRSAQGEFTLPGPVPQVFDLQVVPLVNGALLTLNDKTALVRAENTRADFVTNASHELRSPLSAILGFIETLQGPARDDDVARERFLGIMNREAQRMKRLIEDLLSLSRVEIDEHVRPLKRVDIAQTLGSVIELLTSLAEKKELSIRFEMPETDVHIAGDPDQLFQVFRNLIENAINYSPSGSTINIEIIKNIPLTNTTAHGIAVHIRDQGPGIARHHLPRLTERFYRVDPGRSKTAGDGTVSTGLGLAIVKHIINRHRGKLIIESDVGKGSTFSVILPE
jgi:two-component system phosphate regulon sensor histidine kinase PhoR